MKLAVCVPWSSPFIWTRFVEAMANVRSPEGVEVKWIFGRGWCPAKRHIEALEKALEWGADLLCIFGADQIAPPDMLEKLYRLYLEKGQAVCALIPSRGYFENNNGSKPFQPLAWKWADAKLDENGKIIKRTYRGQTLDPDMTELIKQDGTVQVCHIIGSGCIMFHRDHLLSLKKPWFFETFDKETYGRRAMMDTFFSWRLISEAGTGLFCDTSIKIGHIHDMVIDESFQDRFDDWMDKENVADPNIVNRKGM